MAAVPPKRVKHVPCVNGVVQENTGAYSAVLFTRDRDGSLWIEHLGFHKDAWFAAVVHDLAVCKRSFDSGDRDLSALEQQQRLLRAIDGPPGNSGAVPASSAATAAADGQPRLNYPLTSYLNQAVFWDVLERKPFGQMAIDLRTSRTLGKSLFFGDSWQEGLGERQRRKQQQQQRKPPPPQQQQQHQEGSKRQEYQKSSVSAAGRGVGSPLSPAVAGKAASGAAVAHPPKQAAVQSKLDTGQQRPQQLEQHVAQQGGISAAPSPHKPQRDGQKPDSSAASQQQSVPAAAKGQESPAASPQRASSDSGMNGRRRKLAAVVDSSSDGMGPSKDASPVQQNVAQEDKQPAVPEQAAGPSSAPAPPLPLLAEHIGAGSQHEQQQQQRERPEQEPTNVWAKQPEFPQGSGTYPMYLKAGPLRKGYFTVTKGAEEALLEPGREGEVEVKDAASGRTWTLKSSLQAKSGSRYLMQTIAFNRENQLQAHDILWFKPGTPKGKQLLFGVWRFGTKEADAFAAYLTGGKKAATSPTKAAPRKSQQPQQQAPKQLQQRQQHTDDSSSEDVPVARRPSAVKSASPKQPTSRSAAAAAAAPGSGSRKRSRAVVDSDSEDSDSDDKPLLARAKI